MAGRPDDELLEIEGASTEAAAHMLGGDAGRMAQQLAGTMASSIGEGVAERYARIGARMLADPMPSRLDVDLIDRLSRIGFDADRLRQIRVHRGLRSHAAADALGARAFAVGEQDIFFGRGEFDPSSREGRAVIAHEVAHIAPPSSFGGGGMGASLGGAPLLNERKRGEEDGVEDEAEERQARQAEEMIFAQEQGPDDVSAPNTDGTLPNTGPVAASEQPSISEKHLEEAVMGILRKLERSEAERRGRF